MRFDSSPRGWDSDVLALIAAFAVQDPLAHGSLSAAEPVAWRLMPVGRAFEAWSVEGFRLSASPELREMKLDVFADDRPRSWVLAKIAEVFDAEWRVAPDGATLTPIRARWDAKRALREKHLKAEREAQSQFIASFIQAAELTLPELKKKVDAERAALSALESKGAPGWQDERMRRMEKLGFAPTLAEDPTLYFAARAMRSLSPADRNALLAGETLAASTHGPASVRLPQESLVWLEDATGKQGLTSAAVAFQVHLGHAHFRLCAQGVNLRLDLPSELRFEAEPFQEEAPYERMLAEFAGPRHQRTAMLRLQGRTQLENSPWFDGRWGTGDWLRALHAVSGVDVVAQSLRVPMRQGANPETTVGGWLEIFEQQSGAAVRLEEGALLMRPGMAWKLEGQEISEATWDRLERTAKPGFDPDGLTYASFAGSLTPDERAFFESERPMLSRVSVDPLTHAMPALQVLSALSAGQKSQAAERRAIPLQEISDPGKALFQSALRTGMLRSGALESYLAAAVSPPNPLAFFWDESSQDLVESFPQPGVRVLTPLSEVPDGRPTLRRRDVALHFGYASSASVTFRFALRRPIE